MKFCKHCGAQLLEGALFCENCGQRVEADTAVGGANYRPAVAPAPVPPVPATPVKKNKAVTLLLILAIVLVLIAAGILVYIMMNPSGSANSDNSNAQDTVVTGEEEVAGEVTEEVTEETTEETETVEEAERETDLVDLTKVYNIVNKHVSEGNVGISIYDMKNDVRYDNTRANEAMPASALVNVPILYTISQKLDDNTLEWSDKILFTTEFGGRGSSPDYEDGERYTLKDLTKRMLRFSHNDAVNSLLDYFGFDSIARTCRNDSYTSVSLQRHLAEDAPGKNNYISAKDTTMMLVDLYRSDGAIDKDYLIDNFYISDDTVRTGLGKDLPNDIFFLNQNCVNETIHTETAVVISDDAEYVITVLCYDGDAEEFREMCAEVSKYVYDALNQ